MFLAHRTIESIWQQHSVWSRVGWAALAPFSLLFSLGVRVRTALYDFRLLPVTHAPLNVISIGNLTVGGTGKTPLTLWLAQHLQQRGYHVGILTRGYKGTAPGPTLVGKDGTPLVSPLEVGDEAVMLARRFPGVVIAGRDRVIAANFAYKNFALDAVILDDGFQHRRLHRDMDILLLTAQGPENTWLLPAGPFREPLTSVHRAHAVVVTKKTGIHDYSLAPLFIPNTQHATRNTQHAVPLFHADLVPTALIEAVHGEWHERPLATLAGQRVLVVTAIANPQPLYQTIQEHGATLAQVVEFPDHHSYTHKEWQQLVRDSRLFDMLLTTEKDLVKLERFSPVIARLLALRVQLRLEPAEMFLQTIEHRLRPPQKDRTDHGRPFSH